jgi:hypothetical protein
MELYNINMLLKPIARGLKTLESTQVTCSDVFCIWIGIAIGFTEVFSDPRMPRFPLFHCFRLLCLVAFDLNQYHEETFACYNRRFAIFMNDCTKGMFILAYLLDPGESIITVWVWGKEYGPGSDFPVPTLYWCLPFPKHRMVLIFPSLLITSLL